MVEKGYDLSLIKIRCVIYGTSSDSFNTFLEKSCPKGGILSPFLWLINVDGLLRFDFGRHCAVQVCADGICATISADTPQKLIRIANVIFMRFCEWAGNNKLNYDENETEALLFTRKHKVPDITLTFLNTRVEIKEKVRYLGVILDRKLSWSEHVTTRVNAAKQYSFRLMSAAKTTWGLKPLALRKLYKGVIEGTILYIAPVWVVAVKKKIIQNALRSVQSMSMIAISKGFVSAKTDTVTAVAGCLPLSQRAIEVSWSRYFKKGRRNYWPSQENRHSGVCFRSDLQIVFTDEALILFTICESTSDKFTNFDRKKLHDIILSRWFSTFKIGAKPWTKHFFNSQRF